jgi:NodT family efflux transporter outer membrane factor (OMF) lipoprotein
VTSTLPPRALLLVVCALSACNSLQQPAAPTNNVPVPLAWRGAALVGTPTDLVDWWTRLGDPALPPLVADALARGSDVAVAQARLRQARATRDLAAAGLQPRVGGSASAQGTKSEGLPHGESWRAGLDASWELDLWGGGAATLRAADAALQATTLTLAQTRVVIAAEVATTLVTLRSAQARQAIAERNLASQQQTLQIVQWRLEAGLVTTLDLAQARTAVEQTRAQIPALRSSAAQAIHALAVLAGRPPGALQAILTPSASPDSPGPVQPLMSETLALAIPAEVLRQRPDVLAAEQQLVAAAARVEQADSARLPSLSLGGSIGLSALRASGLGPGAGVASLLASVNLPVLDFGRVQAQVRQQEAARDEAAASYRASLLAALQEVEDTLVALDAGGQQLAAQQAAASASRLSAELAVQRYRSGLVDFQSVLQAQRTQLAAEDGVAATLGSLATTQVRLVKVLGGGWSQDVAAAPNPAIPDSPQPIARR